MSKYLTLKFSNEVVRERFISDYRDLLVYQDEINREGIQGDKDAFIGYKDNVEFGYFLNPKDVREELETGAFLDTCHFSKLEVIEEIEFRKMYAKLPDGKKEKLVERLQN